MDRRSSSTGLLRTRNLTYAKWALLRVISYRCAVFKRQFGRSPGSHEPLFFDCLNSSPVQAGQDEVRRQIREAAGVERVDEKEILAYLRL